jgi:hypothetical protein
MSDQTPQKPKSPLTEPQVLVAIIGGIVTVLATLVGVLPNLVNNAAPAATVVVVTATPAVPTIVPTDMPASATSLPAATMESTQAPVTFTAEAPTQIPASPTPLPPIIAPTQITMQAPPTALQSGNVLLMYDDVSFTLLNQGIGDLSLEGVIFRSDSGEWEARLWGPGLYTALPAGMCLRLRDRAVGQRQPPAPCQNKIFGLLEVSGDARFWKDVTQFDVLRGDQLLVTCQISEQSCLMNLS